MLGLAAGVALLPTVAHTGTTSRAHGPAPAVPASEWAARMPWPTVTAPASLVRKPTVTTPARPVPTPWPAVTAPPSLVRKATARPTPIMWQPSPGAGKKTTTTPVKHLALLGSGATGPAVVALQRRLISLGYWLIAPDGVFDDSTEQAVYALQKAAGIGRDGIVGPQTEEALARGVAPHPRPVSGYVIEVDLEHELVMFVTNSKLDWTLNTSTGGGYTYCVSGSCAIAETPVGQFSIYSEVDGTVVDALGELWRPKYFDGGFALHGDSYVPPFPVSHGCVRVSDEAIDWIWANNLAPVGTPVWVY